MPELCTFDICSLHHCLVFVNTIISSSLTKTHSQLGLLQHSVVASLINRVSYEFNASMDE
jgi:hypothetical protein